MTTRGGTTANGISVGGVNANGNINATGRIGALGKSATSGYPATWAGGIHTFDLYAEGSVGVGPGGGPANSQFDNAGNGYLAGQLNMENGLYLNGNQLWTNAGTLYLNYSNTNNGAVQIGKDSSTEHDLSLPFGNINMSGNINMVNNIITGLSGGVGIGNVIAGWYSDGSNLAARYPSSGGAFYVQGNNATINYMISGALVGGTLFQTGSVWANAFLYSSDERLKKDIEPLIDNLAKVLAIQPVSYKWIDSTRGTGEQIGFIAQQVKKIEPELVYTNASTTMESLDYTRMTPLLVGADQELNQKIAVQQKKLDSQQSQIDELKAEIATLRSK